MHPHTTGDIYVPRGYENTEDVFEQPIDFDWDEYLIDDTSPTVLDPERIEGYEEISLSIMVQRLQHMQQFAQLDDQEIAHIITEIRGEHERRVSENSISMARLVVSVQEYPYIPATLASAIRAARQAKATVRQAAEILSIFPEIGGIEVMKATYPFDEQRMAVAERHFKAEMMKSFFLEHSALQLVAPEKRTVKQAAQAYADAPYIRVTKSKEADITLHNVEMELISRRSYRVLNTGRHQVNENGEVFYRPHRYPIAMSEYLRLKKTPAAGRRTASDAIIDT